jgi:RNA polymerase sigma-70 factor (ECF subfamily)
LLLYGIQQRIHLTANFLSLATEKHLDKSDQELLEHFYRDKNNEWLGILLSRYTLLLFGLCMKYLKNENDAKDAVQQVFIKVIHELSKYKVTYFKSWLYMVGKNHCLVELRGRKKSHYEINDNLLPSESRGSFQDADQKNQSINSSERALWNFNSKPFKQKSIKFRGCLNFAGPVIPGNVCLILKNPFWNLTRSWLLTRE